MGVLDWLDYYCVGLDAGLFTLDDLSDFLERELLRHPEPPLPYVEAAFAVPKGKRAVSDCLSNLFADAHFIPDSRPGCPVERALLSVLRARYQAGEVDLEETVLCLAHLSLHFEPYSSMDAVANYYNLAEEGLVYEMEEVRLMVEELLDQADMPRM